MRGHLRISLKRIPQLFNSMDPSPFYEKDLDADAEHYLVSWAQELAPDEALKLTLHLKEPPDEGVPAAQHWVEAAIHHYFSERQRFARLELHRLLRRGRTSLGIGLAFLATCLALGQLVSRAGGGVLPGLLRESLTIMGWVAMWRPLEIYLYDWWPLRNRRDLFQRMSRMPVELRVPDALAGASEKRSPGRGDPADAAANAPS